MLGELYLQCEMPEPPKESFFKGLFGGGTKSIDREELCKFVFHCKFLTIEILCTRKRINIIFLSYLMTENSSRSQNFSLSLMFSTLILI